VGWGTAVGWMLFVQPASKIKITNKKKNRFILSSDIFLKTLGWRESCGRLKGLIWDLTWLGM
jgi:hypothetical protein